MLQQFLEEHCQMHEWDTQWEVSLRQTWEEFPQLAGNRELWGLAQELWAALQKEARGHWDAPPPSVPETWAREGGVLVTPGGIRVYWPWSPEAEVVKTAQFACSPEGHKRGSGAMRELKKAVAVYNEAQASG